MTNDDGIDSHHLQALARALRQTYRVIIVAPERQRSAVSHSITLHKPLRLREVAPDTFSLSGSPTDCVYVGTNKIVPNAEGAPPLALVLSGPNDGYNLGSDIFYSGTFAGAFEGLLRGYSGLAVSFAPRMSDASAAIKVAVAVADEMIAHGQGDVRELCNLNVPEGPLAGVRYATLGQRHYVNDIVERQDPWGRNYIWVGGGATGHADIPGSDCVAVAAGEASLTTLTQAHLIAASPRERRLVGFDMLLPPQPR